MEAGEEGAFRFTGNRPGASATPGWGVRCSGALGLGTGLSLHPEGATHLSGRHSTARAGSPSGCRRWSRCCLWWLFRCSDPRHTAGLHSTHCPGCRPAGGGEAQQPGSQTRRAPPVPAPAGKPETLRGELTTWPPAQRRRLTEALGRGGGVCGSHGSRGEGPAHWEMALGEA